jgi:hypothetical protein
MSDLLVLQRYKNLDACYVLKLRAPLGAGVFDLVFRAVPFNRDGEPDIARRGTSGETANYKIVGDASHQLNQRMFCNVTEFVEDIERMIPSTATIERSKKRLDFRDQLLASTPYALAKIGGCFPEGKGDVTGVRVSTGCQVGGEGGVVEAGSSMFDYLSGEDSPPKWEALSKLDFVDFVDAIRIRIDDVGVWCFSTKVVNLGFEILEMFFCAEDAHLRAVEGTEFGSHGRQVRSDERSQISAGGEALPDNATTAA